MADSRNVIAKPALQVPTLRFGVTADFLSRMVRLAPIDHAALLAEDAACGMSCGGLRAGVVRPATFGLDSGSWRQVPGGRLWTGAVRSAGATAVRVRFVDLDLPAGGELWVYSDFDPEDPVGPFELRGPSGNGEVWAAAVAGDTAYIEYFEPAGAAGSLRVDGVAHLYRSLLAPLEAEPHGEEGGAQTRELGCHLDSTCYPDWHPVRNATARVAYVSGDVVVLCTGSLLATEAGDLTPYFLTANHCISTQAAAASTSFYWFYQTTVCNGSPPILNIVPRSDVSDFLSGMGAIDQTLLMIQGTLPSGVFFGGWTTEAVPAGTPLTMVHHPGGSYKRISFGLKIPHPGGNNTAFHGIDWTEGTIEGGTSGSGVYRDSDQSLVAVAVHIFAAPSCPVGPDTGAGKFSQFYPTIQSLLEAGSDDAFEPNDACAAAAAIDPGTYNDLVVKSVAEDWYAIDVPACHRVTITKTAPNSWGDIDMQLYDACGGALLASHTGQSTTEVVIHDNNGPALSARLRMYLANDTRAEYDLTIALSPLAGAVTITEQPASQAVCEGQQAEFSVAATGTPTYQWFKDGKPIDGATASTYVIAAATPTDAGEYTCEVTEGACTAVSDPATLSVRARGDVNLDGGVDGADAGPLAAILVDPGSAGAEELCAADVDGNGELTGLDVQAYVGLAISR